MLLLLLLLTPLHSSVVCDNRAVAGRNNGAQRHTRMYNVHVDIVQCDWCSGGLAGLLATSATTDWYYVIEYGVKRDVWSIGPFFESAKVTQRQRYVQIRPV